MNKYFTILGDPGADSGDEGKSKRAEKYGTKKGKERREEPLGTMSYQTSSKRSPPFWLLIGARKLLFFWHQSEARTAATVWNWSGKTLSPGTLLAVLYFSSFHIYFSARLDFPSPPLSAPGSTRMILYWQSLFAHMAEYWPRFVFAFWKHSKRELGQYGSIFPSRSVNNVLEERMLYDNLHKGLKSTTWNCSAL